MFLVPDFVLSIFTFSLFTYKVSFVGYFDIFQDKLKPLR
nr:MAG TPA: hypothetical protein [Bacteriophage sp.]DAT16719.1 MAG TPA: hypothetical protein [Caudoviricetes sp.]